MSFGSDLFGSKPKVPELRKLDFGTEQNLAVGQNTTALPAIENLASLVNLFNQGEWDKALEAAMPGYSGRKTTISRNILDLSEGKIPTDISDRVLNADAARAINSGYAGSGMHRNLVARDLGLTSLDVMQKGLDSMSTWLARTKAPTFDVSSMFVTPAQRANFDVEERNAEFQQQWLKNQIKAMPDPETVGWWNTGWSVVDAVLSAYTGSSVDLGRVNPQGSFSSFSGSGNLGGGSFSGSSANGLSYDNAGTSFSGGFL